MRCACPTQGVAGAERRYSNHESDETRDEIDNKTVQTVRNTTNMKLIHKMTAKIQDRTARVHDDEEGAGVLEYSLVAAVVSVALIGAALTFGQSAVTSAGTAVNGILP